MPIASARRRVVTSTGASWARPCRRCRARGPQELGGDHQAAGAVVVAQHDDAAAAQLGHGALDGGKRSGGARKELTCGSWARLL